MITIRDPSLQRLAIIDNYTSPNIHERINAEFIFTFDTVIDDEKSQYIVENNIVEVEDNYFVIFHHRRQRTSQGELFIQVECEQVNQNELNKPVYNLDFFTVDNTPAGILASILAGTGFTVGTVEFNAVTTFSIQEKSSRRGILIQFGEYMGGEYKFEKRRVSLLQRRGTNRGVQFRVGKNLAGVVKDVIVQNGIAKTAYDIDIFELNSLDEFEGLEYFELGDMVRIIDPDIGVNEDQRIIEYEFDPKIRMNSKVIIANFIDGLEDTIYRIERSTLVKERLYNGIRIGPENGFEAIRSDNLARTIMNATEGIRLQKGDGSGGNWTDQIYLDNNGDAVYKGTITTNQLVAGTAKITSAMIQSITTDQLTAGTAKITSAMIDTIKANQIDVTGGKIIAGQIDATSLHVAAANIDGTITAGAVVANLSMSAPIISAGTIIGATVKTSSGNDRIELNSTELARYNSSNVKLLSMTTAYSTPRWDFTDVGNTNKLASIYAFNGLWVQTDGFPLYIDAGVGTINMQSAVDFNGSVSGITISGVTGLQGSLDGKSSISHNHGNSYLKSIVSQNIELQWLSGHLELYVDGLYKGNITPV